MTKPRDGQRSARGLRRYGWYGRFEIWFAGVLMWLLLRVIRFTVRLERRHTEELEGYWRRGEPVVLAFWHSRAAMAVYFYAGPGLFIMNSTHRDGQAVSQALGRFGFRTTGGSSSRGAVAGGAR